MEVATNHGTLTRPIIAADVTAAYWRLENAKSVPEQVDRFLEVIELHCKWVHASGAKIDVELETIHLLGYRRMVESCEEPEIDDSLFEIIQSVLAKLPDACSKKKFLAQVRDGRIPPESSLSEKLERLNNCVQ